MGLKILKLNYPLEEKEVFYICFLDLEFLLDRCKNKRILRTEWADEQKFMTIWEMINLEYITIGEKINSYRGSKTKMIGEVIKK